MPQDIYLSIGGNLGDRQLNLRLAIGQISACIGTVITVSSIYETAPWGNSNQPHFLNQVIHIQSDMDAESVLNLCLDIEKQLGRTRQEKWGERLIDIDILYIGNLVISTDSTKIPHPHLHKRRFTLVPLNEIASNFTHPVLNETNEKLLEKCEDKLEVLKL